eukprot:3906010-Lingulodinium_polyedra.AAC.1
MSPAKCTCRCGFLQQTVAPFGAHASAARRRSRRAFVDPPVICGTRCVRRLGRYPGRPGCGA